jgi:plasmid stabilization system protein ParE
VTAHVSFHEDAQRELDEATDFYAMERAVLGASFVNAVELTVKRILDHPQSSPVVKGHVRKIRVPRFPYSVLYSLVGDEIRVLALAHNRRRPYYWSGRR